MIDDGGTRPSVSRRCELLEASRSGFYRWLRRRSPEENCRTTGELELRTRIRALHRRWHGLLGYRRMHDKLWLDGIDVPSRTVRRIMKEERLFGRPSGRRAKYRGRSGPASAEDLLRRDFTADAPNCAWVSDITEFKTATGKLYLCPVKDLYDGVIVGWAMDVRASADLVLRALTMAWRKRIEPSRQVVVHSDRGSQYTSSKTRKWIRRRDGLASMGEVGDSADNASAESFFGVLKRDVKQLILSDTRAEAVEHIHDYIVNLHNPLRRAYLLRNRNERSWKTDASKKRRAPWKDLFDEAPLDNEVST